MSESIYRPKTISAAMALLCLSGAYSIIMEIWSAFVIYADIRGLSFVLGVVAGITLFYVFYGWLLYLTWGGAKIARNLLLVTIVLGIAIHVSLAWGSMGELFGPPMLAFFLDSLRVVAAILLLVSPAAYWQSRRVS